MKRRFAIVAIAFGLLLLPLLVTPGPTGAALPVDGSAAGPPAESALALPPADAAARAGYRNPLLPWVDFLVDDGGMEYQFGLNTQGHGLVLLGLNRFTLGAGQYPLLLTEIRVLFPDVGHAHIDLTGRNVDLLVYRDTSGSGQPGNASKIHQSTVQVQTLSPNFSVYPVNIPIQGPGDIYIGFSNTYDHGGGVPYSYPFGIDQSQSQQRSWVIGNYNGSDPNYNDLSNNQLVSLLDNMGMAYIGNFLIRGRGEVGATPNPTSTPTRTPTAGPTVTRPPAYVLYDQYGPISPIYATNSQQYEPYMQPYTDYLADDFVVPAGLTWYLDEVDVEGRIEGGMGPVDSFNVVVYTSGGTVPGSPVYTATNAAYTVVGGGGYHIPLTNPAMLPAGTYWLMVQGNLAYSNAGRFMWYNRAAQSYNQAAWFNPGDGWGTTCTEAWGTRWQCTGDASEPDQVYRLWGTAAGGPTPIPTDTPTRTPTPPLVTHTPTVTGTPPTATITATATATSTATATATPPAGCRLPYWHIMPSPDVGILNAVAAVAANDIWAVGDRGILHWNGLAWSQVPSPATSPLYAVAAVSANDVWAGGTDLLHWNGQVWSIVPKPQGFGTAYGLTALAMNDVWAAGDGFGGPYNYGSTWAIHWDGTQWNVVYNPIAPRNGSRFSAVSASSPTDVWAVGYWSAVAQVDPTVWHWTGPDKSSAPAVLPQMGQFTGVWAAAPNNVWAVGYAAVPPSQVVHWDGTDWSVVAIPAISATLSIAGRTANDVWVVGEGTLHWDGGTWVRVPSPGGTLHGVAPVAADDVWAVGTGSGSNSLITHYSAEVFVDVPTTHPFYPYIQCMACRGIAGGYPCGGPGEPCPGSYYRPNNNVTRGQVSKIISASAGFADPVPGTQQTFEDVAPGSTFHVWIERLATRGIIGGYPCGGPGEPCVAPNNRPYFRPNNNVTRGQLSKITSGAAGWSETPTGQTFEDVPPGSTFYLWIERMAARGVISGYPCGGAGEPCVAPTNRPYFRPNNNATRGQMSKIAASAFFPNCQTPARR